MLLSALIMGLAGSLHCAGMCSPLAMAVTSVKSAAIINRLIYNLGRITTYGLLGAIVATIGYILPIGKFQNWLSLALGVTLIAFAVMGTTGLRIPFLTNIISQVTIRLKKLFAGFINNKSVASLFLMGSLNGILPCGLTVIALSFCITVATPTHGFIYMFTFGLGTLPVMLGFTSLLGFLRNRMHWNIRHVTTSLMALSGILLIVRILMMHEPATHTHHSDIVDIVICR